MRVSEAAVALITGVNANGEEVYLTQWNEKWQSYSLIGGHREKRESLQECCIREVEEELRLQREIDFEVAETPVAPTIEFIMYSKAAGVETCYRTQLHRVQIRLARALNSIDANPLNRWLMPSEIANRLTGDGRPVSEQVIRVLAGSGMLSLVQEKSL